MYWSQLPFGYYRRPAGLPTSQDVLPSLHGLDIFELQEYANLADLRNRNIAPESPAPDALADLQKRTTVIGPDGEPRSATLEETERLSQWLRKEYGL